MSAGDVVRAPDGTPVTLGEIGQRVLLHNRHVRIWEVALEPGGSQPWHLHHNPYVVLCLAASPCRMDWLDGSPARHLSERVGGVVHRPVSPVHMLTNHGDTPYRNRIVELLDLGEEAGGAGLSGPVQRAGAVGAPVEATVVFDDDEVRVWGVELAGGTTGHWRAGRHPAVVIDLTPEPDDDGVTYLAPGGSHVFAPAGAAGGVFRLVELKYLPLDGTRTGDG